MAWSFDLFNSVFRLITEIIKAGMECWAFHALAAIKQTSAKSITESSQQVTLAVGAGLSLIDLVLKFG